MTTTTTAVVVDYVFLSKENVMSHSPHPKPPGTFRPPPDGSGASPIPPVQHIPTSIARRQGGAPIKRHHRSSPAQPTAHGPTPRQRGAFQRQHLIARAQLSMLTAALRRPDRTFTSDDIVTDLTALYVANGPWVGAAVRSLRQNGISVRAGQEQSVRPSRHGAEVKLWRVADDDVTTRKIAYLKTWLAHNPLPPDTDDGGTGRLFPDLHPNNKPSPMAATTGLETAEG